MHKSHVIQLKPTEEQIRFFKKSCGVARFSYNWALSKWKELYKGGEKPAAFPLIKLQNSIKREEFPWMLEVGKCAPQYAIHSLEHAFKRMWTQKSGYPKFKKRGIKDSFVTTENNFSSKVDGKYIWVSRLGWVKMYENLRFEGKILCVTIKRKADKWFASVLVDVPVAPMVRENQSTIGIDLGITTLATLSNGEKFKSPKPLAKYLDKLKREQRWMSRKVAWSKNRFKQQMKVAGLHYRIGNIRNNFLHEITSQLVNKYDTIILEDLAVSNMVKNRKVAQAISDVSLSEFRRQIEYKASWYGAKVIIADRFFPSSKLCSNCGAIHDNLILNIRQWTCQSCGSLHDRDINAAINLANYSPTAKYAGSNAYGVDKVHAEMQVIDNEVRNS